MGKRHNKTDELRDIFSYDPAKVFLVQRRVMTDLYKKYGLHGYQIEMLLLVIRMANYTIGVVVTGPMIRKKVSKRFDNVMRLNADHLVNEGFLEYLYKDGESRYNFKLGMTERAYEFAMDWRDSINRHLEADETELILNARFSWEKAKGKGLGSDHP